MLKYEIIQSDYKFFNGKKVFRIKALKNILDKHGKFIVFTETLGGYVESYKNLSQESCCWIYDDAIVKDNAVVCEQSLVKNNAVVENNAKIIGISKILDNAHIKDNACISSSCVRGSATIQDDACVACGATVRGYSLVKNNAYVGDNAEITDNAVISDFSVVKNNAIVCMNAKISGLAIIQDDVIVAGKVCDNAKIANSAVISSSVEVYNNAYVCGNVSAENLIIKTNKKLGVNFFNDNIYNAKFRDLNFKNKFILDDKSYHQYRIIPISADSCITCMPSQGVDLFLSSETAKKTTICSEVYYSSKKDLWDDIIEEMSYTEPSNKIKKIFCDFFKNTAYKKIENVISCLSNNTFYTIADCCDGSKIIVVDNKELLLSYLKDYFYAYFINLALYVLDEKKLFESKHKESYIISLMDTFIINVANASIVSINEKSIFFNNEIFTMFKRICGFEDDWTSDLSLRHNPNAFHIIPLLD